MHVKHFVIESDHLPYLQVQCGDIAHLIDSPVEWKIAYNARINNVYKSMLPVLPEKCDSLLDIGGGLSGIGARLCEHYNYDALVAVLDGKNTLAVVDKHREPFNNATKTQTFLRANGVRKQDFYSPTDEVERHFDLVISTQAWPFHIGVNTYLPTVVRALRKGGTLIVDVRKAHPEWMDQLKTSFGKPTLLTEAAKWERVAFRVPTGTQP